MMAWRLVSALFFAALLLGERLSSWIQLLGAVVVLVTITWYLWQQGNQTVPMEAK
jgi:drug/metabolite transporter (DMT)-like permease